MKILSAMKMSYPLFSNMQKTGFNRVNLSQKQDTVEFKGTEKVTPSAINTLEEMTPAQQAQNAKQNRQAALERAKEMKGEIAELKEDRRELLTEANSTFGNLRQKMKDITQDAIRKYKALKNGGKIEGAECKIDKVEDHYIYATLKERDPKGNVVRISKICNRKAGYYEWDYLYRYIPEETYITEITEFEDGRENEYIFDTDASKNCIRHAKLGIKRAEDGKIAEIAQDIKGYSSYDMYYCCVELYKKGVKYSDDGSKKCETYIDTYHATENFAKNLTVQPDNTKTADVLLDKDGYTIGCTISSDGTREGFEYLKDGVYLKNYRLAGAEGTDNDNQKTNTAGTYLNLRNESGKSKNPFSKPSFAQNVIFNNIFTFRNYDFKL